MNSKTQSILRHGLFTHTGIRAGEATTSTTSSSDTAKDDTKKSTDEGKVCKVVAVPPFWKSWV